MQHYIANSSWLIGERILSLGAGFLATAVTARYLGPSDFGILAYAISAVGLVHALSHFGLQGLVVRELVKY